MYSGLMYCYEYEGAWTRLRVESFDLHPTPLSQEAGPGAGVEDAFVDSVHTSITDDTYE